MFINLGDFYYQQQFEDRSGLYVVMVNQKVLYIGQAENINQRLMQSHEKYDCWIRHASGQPLKYAVYYYDDSTEQQRLGLESQLIAQHRPPCNRHS